MGFYLREPTSSTVAEHPLHHPPARRSVIRPGSLASKEPHRGPTSSRILSSKYRDRESYLYGFRYYTPEAGRWRSRDPFKETRSAESHVFCSNRPADTLDVLGLLECQSQAMAHRDPWYGSSWSAIETGRRRGCSSVASYSQSVRTLWWLPGFWQPPALCNSGLPIGKSHVIIDARHGCCRKFSVTCKYRYTSLMWTGPMPRGSSINRWSGLQITGFVLDPLHRLLPSDRMNFVAPTQDTTGRWAARQDTGLRTVRKVVPIDGSWRRIVELLGQITVGTRVGGDTGPYVGAAFVEALGVTCDYEDFGSCD
jgi:RHS repeat-associated protein